MTRTTAPSPSRGGSAGEGRDPAGGTGADTGSTTGTAGGRSGVPGARDEGRPYARGYQAPSSLRPLLREAHGTRLATTVLTAVFDQLVVVGAASAAAWPGWWSSGGGRAAGGVCTVLLALLLIGRQFRALECLVHEASHYNWSRHHRRANDICARLLAGVPTGLRIDRYRAEHLVHHSRLGTGEDPDLRRYREQDIRGLDRSGHVRYARSLVTRLLAHQFSWYRTAATDPSALLFLVLWALACVTLPAALLGGTKAAVTASLVVAAAYLLVLPVLRFIGETSEHSYHDADTVFDSTVTNLGILQRYLIHPHGDGYHTVHHLWPGTPHHRLRLLHERLVAEDPVEFADRLRLRRRILDSPSPRRNPAPPTAP